MLDRTGPEEERPWLLDAGGRVTRPRRLDPDVDVELDERWSDGSHHVRRGVATHAGDSPEGPVVHCRWQGPFGQVEAWLLAAWTRRE